MIEGTQEMRKYYISAKHREQLLDSFIQRIP